MLIDVIKFEFWYRSRRPATYIYFGIIFLFAFLAIATDGVISFSANDQVKRNAPATIAILMQILPTFFMLVTSAVMGVAVLRDFEYNTHTLLYSTPLKKYDYLFGRFIGSFLVLVFIYSGIIWGHALGSVMPWVKPFYLGPFNFWFYIQPFFTIAIPTLFVMAAIFFAAGALSRQIMVVYLQGVIFLVLYLMAGQLTSNIENKTLSALLDPTGFKAIDLLTEYWTPAEKNTLTVPFAGYYLLNRLIWMAGAVAILTITYFSFQMNVVRKPWFSRKKAEADKPSERLEISIPPVHIVTGWQANIKQVASLSLFYFKSVLKEIPYQAIVLSGIFLLLVTAWDMEAMYGTEVFPKTYMVLNGMGIFNLFFIIIIIFYSGELIWKERDLRINQLYDVLPVRDFVGLTSKFIGFMMLHIVMLFVLMLTGMLLQTLKGYFVYEPGLYLSSLFTDTLSHLFLYTLLAFFVQIMVNNKFVGHAVMVVFFIANSILATIGIEHRMFRYGGFNLGTYSEMNGFGHYVNPFSWFDLYWTALAMLFFAASIVFAVRGTETAIRWRWHIALMRFSRPLITFAIFFLLIFSASGAYIFYNTNILNKYSNSKEDEEDAKAYELKYKKYEKTDQPRIVEAGVELDLYPQVQGFKAKGFYILKNKSAQAIPEIIIHTNPAPKLTTQITGFSKPFTVRLMDDKFYMAFYKLQTPLAPGDSIRMDFTCSLNPEGFTQGPGNTSVVYNGTFMNNGMFPGLGYNAGIELQSKTDRKKYDLPPKERMAARTDSVGLHNNLFGDDADHIRFGITLSTVPDQIAIAPGYLQKEWQANGRRYFKYVMDRPIANFFSMVSARYNFRRDSSQGVKLEIYYHKGHEYNIDRMMKACKDALAYYNKNFGPYQYRQIRIMEFPRYASFAQSFANTIPFSEGIGFVLNIKPGNVDVASYVTAHEIAHQWWGHQVLEAEVKGNAMLSESLSQYSALMVMKKQYTEAEMQTFLKYELDRYLGGRGGESEYENPLVEVESQQYIHYRKGSVVMYALQDYIGEDSVNAALRRYLNEWKFREDRYPSTADLMPYFRAVTPDSLQSVLTDMFETITLLDLETVEAKAYKVNNKQYSVTLEIESKKFRADSAGTEKAIPVNDLVDIGVYTLNKAGKDSLIYLKKHRINKGHSTITVTVNAKPTKAGIDPVHKLIDRKPEDNVKTVKWDNGKV